eukprot:Tbor_TRINITY_DN4055_c0_g1::TRINITY_DN4055_c0_g1_i1::g.11695::m.11695/K01148/PARN, PNLDC1; poly(A)-specific ribonuclease
MDVIKSNYSEVRDEFISLVSTCEFYAVDAEMTGINKGNKRPTCNSTTSDVFHSAKEDACTYTAFQLGICLFHRVDSSETNSGKNRSFALAPNYIVRPYNFWLHNGSNNDIVLNQSAVEFLLKHNMDFQYWLINCIPYFQRDAAEKKWTDIVFPNPPKCNALSRNDIKCINEMYTEIIEWYDGKTLSKKKKKKRCDECTFTVNFINSRCEAVLHFCLFKSTPQSLWYLYPTKGPFSPTSDRPSNTVTGTENVINNSVCLESIAEEYIGASLNINPNLFFASMEKEVLSEEIVLKFCRLGEKGSDPEVALEEVEKKKKKMKERKALDSLGFFPFFDALVASKKPHLGHNYYSDLLFMFDHHHRDLPNSLQEFKSHVSECFPLVYDTKILAEMMPITIDTSLEPLYMNLEEMVKSLNCTSPSHSSPSDNFISFPEGYEFGSATAHQGAYDAFMTGMVFLYFHQLYTHRYVSYFSNLISCYGVRYWFSLVSGEHDPLHYKCIGYTCSIMCNKNHVSEVRGGNLDEHDFRRKIKTLLLKEAIFNKDDKKNKMSTLNYIVNVTTDTLEVREPVDGDTFAEVVKWAVVVKGPSPAYIQELTTTESRTTLSPKRVLLLDYPKLDLSDVLEDVIRDSAIDLLGEDGSRWGVQLRLESFIGGDYRTDKWESPVNEV